MKEKMLCIVCAFLCMMLAGCSQRVDSRENYPVLRMMSMGNEPEQMEAIYSQLDALTEAELGVDIRISFYPWEDEIETIRKLINSNSFDIYVYGAPFGSEELARKGAFLNMEPYLETVPELVEFYSVQGIELLGRESVYSVPRILNSTGYGFFYREDLRRKWGLEPVTDFQSLECYLYKAREEYSENAPINDKRFFSSLLELMVGEHYYCLDYGMGICWDTGELVRLLDTPEYRTALETAVKWYQDGIISQDILYLQNNNTMSTLEMMKEDKAAVEFCNHFSAICSNYVLALNEVNPEWELGWLDYNLLNNSCYDTYFSGDGQIGLAVDSKCKYPEAAMEFLEKIHTDSRYYNLLSYGVEGIHYQQNEDGTISYENIPAENIFRGQIGLEQDTMMLTPQYPGSWDAVYRDVQERFANMRALNGESEIPSFSVVSTAYPDSREAMTTYTDSRIRRMLETGTMTDIEDGISRFREELESAGYDVFFDAVKKEWEQFQMIQGGIR